MNYPLTLIRSFLFSFTAEALRRCGTPSPPKTRKTHCARTKRYDLFGDELAVVGRLSLFPEEHHPLTVKDIDGRVFFIRGGVIIVRLPDMDFLFVAAAVKGDFVEYGMIIDRRALGVRQ